MQGHGKRSTAEPKQVSEQPHRRIDHKNQQAVKTFGQLSYVLHKAKEPRAQAPVIRPTSTASSCFDDKVAGGIMRPQPVDRAAAMLLAKAPWWAHEPSNRKKDGMSKGSLNTTSNTEQVGRRDFLGKVDCTDAIVTKDGEAMYDMDIVAKCFIKHMEEHYPKDTSDIARAMLDARLVLNEQMKTIGAAMDEFERVTKDAVLKVRSNRMASVTEASTVVNALKDVRQFFLGSDYEKETKRLAEFVDLCERLKKLKDSGFLDTVADTMLRLSSTTTQSV